MKVSFFVSTWVASNNQLINQILIYMLLQRHFVEVVHIYSQLTLSKRDCYTMSGPDPVIWKEEKQNWGLPEEEEIPPVNRSVIFHLRVSSLPSGLTYRFWTHSHIRQFLVRVHTHVYLYMAYINILLALFFQWDADWYISTHLANSTYSINVKC